jgi:hypothetical protein
MLWSRLPEPSRAAGLAEWRMFGEATIMRGDRWLEIDALARILTMHM